MVITGQRFDFQLLGITAKFIYRLKKKKRVVIRLLTSCLNYLQRSFPLTSLLHSTTDGQKSAPTWVVLSFSSFVTLSSFPAAEKKTQHVEITTECLLISNVTQLTKQWSWTNIWNFILNNTDCVNYRNLAKYANYENCLPHREEPAGIKSKSGSPAVFEPSFRPSSVLLSQIWRWNKKKMKIVITRWK